MDAAKSSNWVSGLTLLLPYVTQYSGTTEPQKKKYLALVENHLLPSAYNPTSNIDGLHLHASRHNHSTADWWHLCFCCFLQTWQNFSLTVAFSSAPGQVPMILKRLKNLFFEVYLPSHSRVSLFWFTVLLLPSLQKLLTDSAEPIILYKR